MTTLKGMTWDHLRGYAPLEAANQHFSKLHPDVKIEWKKRSLKDFGDYPLSLLASEYDLIIIDHPFIRQAYKDGILIDLTKYVGVQNVAERLNAFVGKSQFSYMYENQCLAFAVDAAAQVAAYNPVFFFSSPGYHLPVSFDEVIRFAKSLPSDQYIVATHCPTDIISIFLGFCAQIDGNDFFDSENGIDSITGQQSVSMIRRLDEVAHPMSNGCNPIQALEAMSTENDIVYCPYLFGYSNYARAGYRKNRLDFSDAPLIPDAKATTLLGGTGIAVSAKCIHPDIAAAYASFVSSPQFQCTDYYYSGGQPAAKEAWLDPEINVDSNNFFTNTLKTLQEAYMRPRLLSWNVFQEEAGNYLNASISTTEKDNKIVKGVNQLFQKYCCSITPGT